MALTNKQEGFAQCVAIKGMTQADAYRANYKCDTWAAHTIHDAAYKLADDPDVSHRITELRASTRNAAVDAATVDVMRLLRRYVDIAFVDPNELITVAVDNCRYCHGDGNLYQWREREYLAACDKAVRAKDPEPLPDIAGGFGFRQARTPNPECVECDGRGVSVLVPKDTSRLSPGALALYCGAQQTKDGIKILFADRDAALDQIGRIIGAFDDRLRIELQAKVNTLQLTTTDPAEAAKMYVAMMTGG
jgi:phage terminase small subunit